jgi:hypothetical protein
MGQRSLNRRCTDIPERAATDNCSLILGARTHSLAIAEEIRSMLYTRGRPAPKRSPSISKVEGRPPKI